MNYTNVLSTSLALTSTLFASELSEELIQDRTEDFDKTTFINLSRISENLDTGEIRFQYPDELCKFIIENCNVFSKKENELRKLLEIAKTITENKSRKKAFKYPSIVVAITSNFNFLSEKEVIELFRLSMRRSKESVHSIYANDKYKPIINGYFLKQLKKIENYSELEKIRMYDYEKFELVLDQTKDPTHTKYPRLLKELKWFGSFFTTNESYNEDFVSMIDEIKLITKKAEESLLKEEYKMSEDGFNPENNDMNIKTTTEETSDDAESEKKFSYTKCKEGLTELNKKLKELETELREEEFYEECKIDGAKEKNNKLRKQIKEVKNTISELKNEMTDK